MPDPLVYLTEDEVIRFNESITGQKGLLRDRAALEGALNRPKMAAFYQQGDIVEQAALLIEGIARKRLISIYYMATNTHRSISLE